MIPTEKQIWPSLAVVAASVLWGLYWLPLRISDGLGITGAWPSLLLNGFVVLALLPFIVRRWRGVRQGYRDLVISGLAIGVALSFYGISVNLTDVVRTVLLFYLTPVWSTLIELIWLKARLTRRRLLALSLGLVGMIVVLKADHTLPLPQNLGDWLAFFSGMAWSVGSARVFVSKSGGALETCFAFALGTVVVTGAMLAVLPAAVLGVPPDREALRLGGPLLALGGLFFMLPILYLTVWGAQRLPPATVGLLLMGDIIVGVLSAALLLPEETFGPREVIGTVLIAGAGVVEVWPKRRPTA